MSKNYPPIPKPLGPPKTVTVDGKEYPYPIVGLDIYVRTAGYIGHGVDDFQGGLCRITKIIDRLDEDSSILDYNRLSIQIEERPGYQYNWFALMDEQEKLREQFSADPEARGHPDPDDSPESNRGW